MPHSSSDNRNGRRGNNRGAQRGSRGSTYYTNGPHSPTHSLQHMPTSSNASTASEVIPPESYPYFAGVLHHVFTLDKRRSAHRWIFDNDCSAHSAFLHIMFHHIEPCQDQMFAANGTSMSVRGTGVAWSISNVFYLPDLQAVFVFSEIGFA